LLGPRVFRVLDDPDDLVVHRALWTAATEMPADRIGVAEESLRERLVDDYHSRRAWCIAFVDHPSAEQPRTDGLEVARPDPNPRRRVARRRLCGPTVDADRARPVISFHRAVLRNARACHAGNPRQGRLQLFVEAAESLRTVAGE